MSELDQADVSGDGRHPRSVRLNGFRDIAVNSAAKTDGPGKYRQPSRQAGKCCRVAFTLIAACIVPLSPAVADAPCETKAYAACACADLRRADLTGADLTEANLQAANLTASTLAKANLTDADLKGATIRDADFDGGTWRPGADRSGATWTDGTVCTHGSAGDCLKQPPEAQ